MLKIYLVYANWCMSNGNARGNAMCVFAKNRKEAVINACRAWHVREESITVELYSTPKGYC